MIVGFSDLSEIKTGIWWVFRIQNCPRNCNWRALFRMPLELYSGKVK